MITASKGLKDKLGVTTVRYKDISKKTTQKTQEEEYKSLAWDSLIYSEHGEKGFAATSEKLGAQVTGKEVKADVINPRLAKIRAIAKKAGTGASRTANILAYAKAESDKLKLT